MLPSFRATVRALFGPSGCGPCMFTSIGLLVAAFVVKPDWTKPVFVAVSLLAFAVAGFMVRKRGRIRSDEG